jgi:dTDP-4-dehydrorhamnose 3,5-epimerase
MAKIPIGQTMQFTRFQIEGPILIQGKVHRDDRGSFCETWRLDAFEVAELNIEWQQDNQSHSLIAATIRGLHWQIGPDAQAKLVRPIRGQIFDVAVDLRRSSSTFGKSVSVILDSQSNQQLFVPIGFAHGFCTMDADTIVTYKTSKPYAPSAERSLAWDDTSLGIQWPLQGRLACLSPKDAKAPYLTELTQQDLTFV